MNAIKELYLNTRLITEDGYVKVRDGLWVKSGPYEKQEWDKADKSILPTKEEIDEIYLKFQELIQIQEACGLHSLRQILNNRFSWIWSSTECNSSGAWTQRMSDGYQTNYGYKDNVYRVVPIRRSL